MVRLFVRSKEYLCKEAHHTDAGKHIPEREDSHKRTVVCVNRAEEYLFPDKGWRGRKHHQCETGNEEDVAECGMLIHVAMIFHQIEPRGAIKEHEAQDSRQVRHYYAGKIKEDCV